MKARALVILFPFIIAAAALALGGVLLLPAARAAPAAPVTFTIDTSDNGQSTITKTVGGITLTLSNCTCNGVSRNFRTDNDGIFLRQTSGHANSCVSQGDGCDAFSMSFDSAVTLQSYEVGYVDAGASGTFVLTATSGNSLNNPLNPVGTYAFNSTPSLAAAETASVTVSMTGGGPNQIKTITVDTGPVSAPEIDVQGNGQSIPDGDASPSTADHTDFGSVTLGGAPITHTFTISNSGNADLNLSGTPVVTLTVGTHFSVTAQPSSPVISNTTTTFAVTFDPSAAGSFTDTINIANNDADENPYTFVISGTGTVASAYTLTVSKDGAGSGRRM